MPEKAIDGPHVMQIDPRDGTLRECGKDFDNHEGMRFQIKELLGIPYKPVSP